MDTRAELEAALRAELLRVIGPGAGELPGIDGDTGDEELARGIAHLRTLPDGIGFGEMMRRLRQPLPA